MIKVLKFGGTSVGSAENMKRVAEIVRREQATVTVLSAMSGTTDALVKISRLAVEKNLTEIEEVIDMLRDKYTNCIEGLLVAHRGKALERMEHSQCGNLLSSQHVRTDDYFTRRVADFGYLYLIYDREWQ